MKPDPVALVYKCGYEDRRREDDYDPTAHHPVTDLQDERNAFLALAENVAGGNFNQAAVIAEARRLVEGARR